jgi:hypothetical protein
MRLVRISLLLTISLLLAGCGQGAVDSTTGSTAAEVTPPAKPSTTTTARATTTTRAPTTTTTVAAFDWSTVTLDDLLTWRTAGYPDGAVLSLGTCESAIRAIGSLSQILIDGAINAFEIGSDVEGGLRPASEAIAAFGDYADAAALAKVTAEGMTGLNLEHAALDVAFEAEDAFNNLVLPAVSMSVLVFDETGIDSDALATWGGFLEEAVQGLFPLLTTESSTITC